MAQEERPGATHLEFPEDIAVEQTDATVIPGSYTRRPTAEEKAIAQAIAMITQARRPLLVIGAGANRKLTARMLRRFIDKTGIPFVSTQMGKGVVDEREPHYLGNAALSANDFVHRAIGAADLLINVGHDVVEKPPFFMERQTAQVIHLNFFSAKVDAVYFPQLEVVGDIANSFWQITERILPSAHWDFTYFEQVKVCAEQYNRDGVDDPRFPLHPRRLVADVRAVLPADGVLALDNGIYKIWFARNYPAYAPNTVLLDNALATMGAGLPSAIAARLVYPQRPVLAVCGDGGFMMNSQELETAVRLQLHLVVLILRDDSYGMIKWKQDNLGFASFGLDFGNPDFVKYAESYGAHGHRVETSAAFRPLLERCLHGTGIHLIECPMDYSENDRILNREIQERSDALPSV
jgi:acetolactate synthase I/II/III large subunit